ncbi:MAG: type II toxin-antitoxin system mRNA interferase toxin, RelE/StbE family [Euryarchaeota archaeon]|nr:type II toxin-antitoxin system mRNA interferase toxin, RelE/StbE family [Euryarchaeota archaeon]
MVHRCTFSPDFDRAFRKIKKRDRLLFERIAKKMEEILDDPEVYKPLRGPLKGLRRVHIGPFVVIFETRGETVEFIVIEHHDRAYGR